jgi:hypothetical protein
MSCAPEIHEINDIGHYRAEVDRATAPEWSEFLDRFQDATIYQTWSYGAVRWGARNLSHLVLRRGNEVAAIAQLRLVRLSLLRGGIAYLRWGPLSHLRGRELEPAVFRAMARALHEEYVQRRGLMLRVLPPAFAGSPQAEVSQAAFSGLGAAFGGSAGRERTFLLELGPSLEDLRKNLQQKWRNQLNRAEKNGLTVSQEEGIEGFRVFAEIYRAMRARKRFDTTVDVDEFARIQADLPEYQRMKVLICREKGLPVSGIVCSAMGNLAIYLLGATNDNGLNAKGAYLLQWTMIQWLKENGFLYYDLGGIDPERNPGVYHFKRGLSGGDVSRVGAFDLCQNRFSAACIRVADLVRHCREFWGRMTSRGGAISRSGARAAPEK